LGNGATTIRLWRYVEFEPREPRHNHFGTQAQQGRPFESFYSPEIKRITDEQSVWVAATTSKPSSTNEFVHQAS
jgi:hypothetical protein